jgi:hypothetical protein
MWRRALIAVKRKVYICFLWKGNKMAVLNAVLHKIPHTEIDISKNI